MNALLRWLISITDVPLPRQSVSSSRACSRTSSGSAAGPAAKLNTRTNALLGRMREQGNTDTTKRKVERHNFWEYGSQRGGEPPPGTRVDQLCREPVAAA